MGQQMAGTFHGKAGSAVQYGGMGIQKANIDLLLMYSALNDNSVLGQNSTYGASWRQPTALLPARMLQFSGQLVVLGISR